jgi:hypothetical protein
MEKTCTVQGAFNKNKVLQGFDDFNRNLELLTDVTFFDFSNGCTNLNNTVYNFQPCHASQRGFSTLLVLIFNF